MTTRLDSLALRASFAAGSRLTPRRAAHRAANLWFTVPSRAMPPSPAAPAAGTDRVVEGAGAPLRIRSWGAGPVVCFVHGWGGRGDQINGLVQPLLDRGMQVVTFDAPGHPATAAGPQQHSNAVQTARALAGVAAEYGSLHAIVAHSLGAMATVIAARRGWIDAQRFALISPVTEIGSQLDRFMDALSVGARARRHLDREVRRHTGLGIGEFAYSGQDACLRGTRLIAVHDLHDRFVPYAGTEALVASWPGARLETTDGLGHVRILGDPGVAHRLAAWIGATGTSTTGPSMDDFAGRGR